jgi:hypothetical protein
VIRVRVNEADERLPDKKFKHAIAISSSLETSRHEPPT